MSDWETYRSLRLSSLKDSPDSFGSTFEREAEYSDDEWMSRLNLPSREDTALPLVAEVNGVPSGLAWGLLHQAESKTAHIYQMWVRPESRGMGIGRALIEYIISWATASQLSSLSLAVTTSNSAAISLYHSLGFVPVGEPEELRTGSPLRTQPMILALCVNAA
ncbi:GNAT family N-acetyltransferase [Pseudomonas sp. MBLB4123]|uniref:GNAT family N-acetyltransferase n=1 Tax=Pseudomonas sp. MBLB4123 TaxID=3451557 RepID=UPI003F754E28